MRKLIKQFLLLPMATGLSSPSLLRSFNRLPSIQLFFGGEEKKERASSVNLSIEKSSPPERTVSVLKKISEQNFRFDPLGQSYSPLSKGQPIPLENGSPAPFILKNRKACTSKSVISRTKREAYDKEFLNIICPICYTDRLIDEAVARQKLLDQAMAGLMAER